MPRYLKHPLKKHPPKKHPPNDPFLPLFLTYNIILINTDRTRSRLFYFLIKKVLDKNVDFRKKFLPIEISFNFCPKISTWINRLKTACELFLYHLWSSRSQKLQFFSFLLLRTRIFMKWTIEIALCVTWIRVSQICPWQPEQPGGSLPTLERSSPGNQSKLLLLNLEF